MIILINYNILLLHFAFSIYLYFLYFLNNLENNNIQINLFTFLVKIIRKKEQKMIKIL